MMNQEEYMEDVNALRKQGFTLDEIADVVGYHPRTISKWLGKGGPPAKRAVAPTQRVIDDRWADRITDLLDRSGNKLLGTSIYELLVIEGYRGSYSAVVRHLRSVRGPRFNPAPSVSVPIETGPGEESQFDFSDCSTYSRRWGWKGDLYCFGCILCWSRWKSWWFTTSQDRNHTFEGLIRHFEEAGGTTMIARTDRMGALGTSQGKRFKLHSPVVAFANHYGIEIKACQAGDAKRKGKVERPFRDCKESFLEEMSLDPPGDLNELNRRVAPWLDARLHHRPHSTTGVAPALRLESERRVLGALASKRFDTAYVDSRRVGRAVPLIEWEGVSYSVPPVLVGATVTCRVEVGSSSLQICYGGEIVATHEIAGPGSDARWDRIHRASAEGLAMGRAVRRADLGIASVMAGEKELVGTLDLPGGDYHVDIPDLAARIGSDCGRIDGVVL